MSERPTPAPELEPPDDEDDDITEDALAIEQHDEYRRITE